VLANAKCDVLQGQCLRSNAGLFYANYPEFAETLRAIDTTPSLQAALGRNGRTFFERHYAWPVIEKKYVDMLQQLARTKPAGAMEPVPGWFARRRRSLPPADGVVKQLPAGPYRQPAAGSRPSAIGSQPSAVGSRPSAGPERSRRALSSRQAATGSPGHRPQFQQRRDRNERRDQRRPEQRGPDKPKADSREPKAESREPFDSAQGRPKAAGPKAEGDPRRRPHRRGRRPQGRGGR
jgi:hypothetical protein